MQTFETFRKGKKVLTHYYGRKDQQAFQVVCDAAIIENHPTGIDSEFNPGHVMEIFSFCVKDRVRHVPHADLFPLFFGFVAERRPHLIYQNFKDDFYVFEKALIARGVNAKLARQVLMETFHQDIMVTDFVHDEVDPQHGLKHQERKWLNRPRKEYQELFFYIPAGKKTKITMQPHTILRSLPEDALAVRSKEEWFKLFITYAGDDAEGTRDLYPVHRAYMEKIGYWERFNAPMGDVEWTRTLTKVQERGVCVDPVYFEGIRQQVVCAQQRLRHRMRCAAGMPTFNPGSTPQKQHLFFKKLRWPTRPDMMTKGGSPSLDREAMTWYAEEHGFGLAKLMLAFTKEESTRRSVEAILAGIVYEKYRSPRGRRYRIAKLYTSFAQIIADTGRISSRKVRKQIEVKKVLKNGTVKLETKTVESGLQLQNVPVRVEKDPYKIRRGFIAPPGRKLIVSDYSGIELLTTILWAVRFAGKSRMLDALLKYGTPSAIHGLTAIAVHELSRKLNPLEVKEKHPDQYADGKTCNFNLIFGGTWKVLCRVLGIDYRDPKNEELTRRMVRVWFETWPEMEVYQREIVNLGYEQGWVPIIDGRRAHVDQGLCSDDEGTRSYWERKCKNCVDEETEALTQTRGWVRGFDLRKDEVILTKNAETGQLEWQQMTELKLYPDSEGEYIEFRSRSFSAVTTRDHRWLVYNKGTGEDECRVSEKISLYGDHRIHRTGKYRGALSEHDDAFVELCGWFLTDGSFCWRKRKTMSPRAVVFLFQSKRANLSKVKRIRRALRRMDWKCWRSTCKRSKLTKWGLPEGASNMLHEMFPERVLTMEFLQTLSKRQLRLLLRVMMLGDGSGDAEGKRSFCCRSPERAGMFQILCTLCGYSSSVRARDMSKYKPKSAKLKNVPKMGTVWIVTIHTRDKAQILRRQRRDFSGKVSVWCPMVPNTYFVARREGQVYITGNTPAQGSAAVFMKIAANFMENCPNLRKMGARQLLWVHDEAVLDAPDENAEEAKLQVVKHMTAAGKYTKILKYQPPFDLVVSAKIADNWLAAK